MATITSTQQTDTSAQPIADATENPVQTPTNGQSTQATEEPKTELSPLERAKMNDSRSIIKLTEEELYDEFEQFGTEPGQYKEGSPIQGEFWRYRFRGTIVTVSPEFKRAFNAGEILKVIATPTVGERTVPDPNNSGKTKQEIVYGWSISFNGIEKMQKTLNAKKLAAKMKLDMMVEEKKQEVMAEAVIKKLTPENLSKYITQEEIDKMLAAV